MSYLRNAWYVAGWQDEVENGGLFHRRILDEQILLVRDQAGMVHALADRCPHRFAPLHLGKRHGDVIECAYHGLRFDMGGRCVLNPQGEGAIPAGARTNELTRDGLHTRTIADVALLFWRDEGGASARGGHRYLVGAYRDAGNRALDPLFLLQHAGIQS